jgi:hypothetical protein
MPTRQKRIGEDMPWKTIKNSAVLTLKQEESKTKIGIAIIWEIEE